MPPSRRQRRGPPGRIRGRGSRVGAAPVAALGGPLGAGSRSIARRRLVAALAAGVAAARPVRRASRSRTCRASSPAATRCPPADDADGARPRRRPRLRARQPRSRDRAVRGAPPRSPTQLPLLQRPADRPRGLALLPGPAADRARLRARRAALVRRRGARSWSLGGVGRRPSGSSLLEVADAEGADALRRAICRSGRRRDRGATRDRAERRRARTSPPRRSTGFLADRAEDGVRAVIDTATGAEGAESLADDAAATRSATSCPTTASPTPISPRTGRASWSATRAARSAPLAPFDRPRRDQRRRGLARAPATTTLELAVRSAARPRARRRRARLLRRLPALRARRCPSALRPTRSPTSASATPARRSRRCSPRPPRRRPGSLAGFEDLVETLRAQGGVDLEARPARRPRRRGGVRPRAAPDEAAEARRRRRCPYLRVRRRRRRRGAAARGARVAAGPARRAPSTRRAACRRRSSTSRDRRASRRSSLRVSPASSSPTRSSTASSCRHRPGRDRAAGRAARAGSTSADALRAGDRGLPRRGLAARLLRPRRAGRLGEQLGLAEDPVYATFAGEFRTPRRLGLAVTRATTLLATDARLLLGEPGRPSRRRRGVRPESRRAARSD